LKEDDTLSKEKVPMKIVVPIIVVTWILSVISAWSIAYMAPNLFQVRSGQIRKGLISSDKIANEAIITVKLADGNITSAKILDGNITAVDLADGSIITLKISNGAVTTAKIEDGAVTTNKIANEAIITVKLADGNITSAKILDGNITAVDLATNAVTEITIEDSAVTENKIADGAVTTDKIANGSVTTDKLADDVNLAAGAISYGNVSTSLVGTTTNSSFEDMPGMSVNITVAQPSALLIMFSGQAGVSVAGNSLYVKAMVNTTQAHPRSPTIIFTSSAYGTDWNSNAFIFHLNVTAGMHTVKMQWKVSSGTGRINEATLIVIALPA